MLIRALLFHIGFFPLRLIVIRCDFFVVVLISFLMMNCLDYRLLYDPIRINCLRASLAASAVSIGPYVCYDICGVWFVVCIAVYFSLVCLHLWLIWFDLVDIIVFPMNESRRCS